MSRSTQAGNKAKVVEKRGRVSLVILSNADASLVTWAVRGPQQLTGKLMYWTQPDEASARDFYTRLCVVIEREGK